MVVPVCVVFVVPKITIGCGFIFISFWALFKKVSRSVFLAIIANIFVAKGGDMSRCGGVTKTTSKFFAVFLDMSVAFALVSFGAGFHKCFIYFEGVGSRVLRKRAFRDGRMRLEGRDNLRYCRSFVLLWGKAFFNAVFNLFIYAFNNGF